MTTKYEHSYHILASQVGGHPGVMTSEDGSLVIKPALPVEVSFYQTALSDAAFTPLVPYIPEFYGTLRLEGEVDKEKSIGGSIVVARQGTTVHDHEKDECMHAITLLFVVLILPGLHIP